MGNKKDFAQEIFTSLPDDLRAKLGGKFGTFSSFSTPNDVDSATITATKVLLDIHHNLIAPLSGLPIVDLLLYIGTLNPVIMSGMFAGMEALESSGPFDIISPQDGGVYPGFFDAWTVRADDVEEISVTVGSGEGAESFKMSQNDGVWSAKWPMPIGDHSATFSDGTNEQSVSFSVVTYEAYATVLSTNEDTKEVELRFELPEGSGLESGEITVTTDSGDVVNVILEVTSAVAFGVAVVAGAVGAPVVLTVAGVLGFASGATMLINNHFEL